MRHLTLTHRLIHCPSACSTKVELVWNFCLFTCTKVWQLHQNTCPKLLHFTPLALIFPQMNVDTVNKTHLEQLRLMIDRDPVHQLHEQDKELIWLLRYECQYHFPESLPKLVSCVQWNNHIETAQVL